jgi:hypothetical protein
MRYLNGKKNAQFSHFNKQAIFLLWLFESFLHHHHEDDITPDDENNKPEEETVKESEIYESISQADESPSADGVAAAANKNHVEGKMKIKEETKKTIRLSATIITVKTSQLKKSLQSN